MPTQSDGSCRINGVLLGEMKLSLLDQGAVVLEVVYALCDVTTGERFGRGTRNANWSESTLARLAELTQLIEEDILADVFVGGSTAPVGDPAHAHTSDGVPGL